MRKSFVRSATADGKSDLAAPAPRTLDGEPDFSGIWLTGVWTVTLRQRLALNTELVDEIGLENEQSLQRMK